VTAELRVGERVLGLLQGDITRLPADAIVNAANEALTGGGGVDGAIHRSGGPAIMADLERRYGRTRRCLTGNAVVSDAGDLPATWIIHAVGPRWSGGNVGEARLLTSAYRTSLRLADELGARTVNVPAISAGIYGYPIESAAPVILRALKGGLERARSIERVSVVLYSDIAMTEFEAALGRLEDEPDD
jgi:O-acetyl-ADP-ribose deacetylase (regulator of RNase III)